MRVGAGEGDSVVSVSITFFSSHDLQPAPRPRSALPCLRTSRVTPTTFRLVLHFKPELKQSKGANVRGTASQRLTAE